MSSNPISIVEIVTQGPQGIQGIQGPQGPSITDGDKGDITVSDSGATFTIDNGVVSTAKIADDAVTADKLADTSVSAGSYTNTNITVDAQGRITAAANGSGGGGGTITSVTGSSPIVSSGGNTPAISITAATGSAAGSMSASDKSKLDGIESNATADQTASEIKTAYESNSDTNAFTDAEKTKLSGIETSADVTDASNVDAAGAIMNSDLDGKGEILVGDGSGDPTALSVGTNGYVLKANSSTATGLEWAAESGGGGGGSVNSVSGTAPIVSSGGTTPAISITAATTSAAGSMSSSDKSKLDGIESGATADQTKSDIDALGIAALTATTLENARTIAGVSFDGSADISLNNNAITNGAGYITSTLTEEQVEDYVGGMVTGNTQTGITVTYQDSDGTLDFVVTSQTDNNFTTTLKNKLDGIEASADVTDATNVASAGAIMDGDFTSNGFMKRTGAGSYTVDTNTYITDLVFDTTPQLGGDLDMNSKFISSGILGIKNTGSQSELRLYCESSNAHYASIKAPAHADFSGDITFTLPANYGSNGQVLQSNGSGGTSWVAQTTAYTNSSVDSHLNTSSASTNEILSWNGSDYDWIAQSSGSATISSDDYRNTKGGSNAGNNLGSGTADNTLFGYDAGKSLNTGDYNTVIGANALEDGTSSEKNVVIGSDAGLNATTANRSVFIGYESSKALTTGNYNITIGAQAGDDLTTGSDNIFIGLNSGNLLTTGSNNICLGPTQPSSATVSNEVTIGNSNVTKFRVPGIDFILKDNGGTPTEGHVLTVDANGEASFAAASGGGGLSSDSQYNTVGGTNAGDSFSGTDAEYNTLIGYNAGTAINTGDKNTSVGANALESATSGYNNSVFGWKAGTAITNGYHNTLNGSESGRTLTKGDYNTAYGSETLYNITTGNQSTVIGYQAGYSLNSTGNVAVGYHSLKNTNTGQQNTALGRRALYGQTTGSYNVAVGAECMGGGTLTANDNVAMGYAAMYNITSAGSNVTLGNSAGYSMTTGSDNTILGSGAANSGSNNLTTGSNNILLGHDSTPSSATVSNEITLGDSNITKFRIPGIDFVLKDNGGTPTQGHVLTVDSNGEASFEAASGGGGGGLSSDAQFNTVGGTNAGDSFSGTDATNNTLIGYNAGTAMTTGIQNTAYGSEALSNETSGTESTVIGYKAGKQINGGNKNTALGHSALENTTTGQQNVACGNRALNAQTSGNYNVAVGSYTMAGGNITSQFNVGVGQAVMYNITSGTGNLAAGTYAGYKLTTGSDNTILGKGETQAANNLTTGSNNILLGHDAVASSATVSNEITFGDSNISSLRCNVQTISSLSDARDKTNVIDLPEGLDFINKLRPVKFEWATRDGNGKDGSCEHGFIAQDLQKVQKDNNADYLNMVMDNNPDRLEASYGKLVPILVKAIQELTIEVNKLKSNV